MKDRTQTDCVPQDMRKVSVLNDGKPFDMVVLGDDDIVSKHIAAFGMWEISTCEAMAIRAHTVLSTNVTFLDIGANVGYYSLLFASKGHNVVAIEPMSRNRRALE